MRQPISLEGSPHWDHRPIKYLFTRVQRPPRDGDGIVTAFRDGQVTLRANRRAEGFTNAIQEIGYQGIRNGDLVVHSMDGFAGAIGVSDSDGKASPVVHAYRPTHGVDARFFAYLLRELARHGFVTALAKGVRERSTAFDSVTLQSLVVPVPPPSKQRAIADYLDAETTRIDALIAKKRGLLNLFKDRVDAWRYEAFAGIGRPTGIPSMPEVPLGWDVLRNKVVLREVNDPSPDGNGEMLSVSHLTGVTPRREKNVNMFEAESTVGYKRVRPGDLVINTMWAWMGAAGVSRYNGIVSPAYGVYRFRSNRVLPEFYDVLVRSQAYIDEMTRFSRGVTSSRLRLYPEEFLALRCPVPQVEAQERLAANYRDQVVRFETLDRQLTHQIDLLVERRQALITAAVTAELEIPGMPA